MFYSFGMAVFRRPAGSGDKQRARWPVKAEGQVGRWTALFPESQELAALCLQGCRQGREAQRHVGVILVLGAMAGPVIRTEIIIVMTVPVVDPIREVCG